MIIRKYKQSDTKQVYELIEDVIKEIFNFELQNAKDLADIKANYDNKGGVFYVASHNKNIIGTIGVFLYDDSSMKIAKIKRMYVHKDCRKKGVGQKLIDKVFAFCKQKHYSKITLTTYPQMKAAIRFYKRNGFKKQSIAKDGGIIMIKILNRARSA